MYIEISKRLKGLLRQCISIPQKLYNITKRLKTKKEAEQYFPDFLAFVDFTKQPILRPKNWLRRRIYYSDKKKKKHKVKNLYAANKKRLIIYKSKHKQIGRKEA